MDKFKKICKELLPYIIIITVVVLIRTFIVTPIRVSGPSMNPTLKNGDIMILNKLSKIDRFDIVVINSKHLNDVLIKRVIALPGETLEVVNGVIYINGKKLDDKYAYGKTSDVGKMKIPEGEYFVMGDNREVSADSRLFGTFKKSEIKGTTRFTLFPFNRFGFKK